MNQLLKILLPFVVAVSFGLSDKIVLVVNNEIFTESDVQLEMSALSKLVGDPKLLESLDFRQQVKDQLVYKTLIREFAEHNQMLFTPEEEANVVKSVMENQGKSVDDLDKMAEEAGLNPDWLKAFFVNQSLQQRVGMAVVGHDISINDDQLEAFKHEFYEKHTQYKLKSWTIDLDHPNANIKDIRALKEKWATGVEPTVGEVQDLGWKRRADLPDVFLAAIAGIEDGNLVGPVKSEFGYHLVWFEKESRPDLSEDQIVNQVMNKQFMEKFEQWIKKLPDYGVVIDKDESESV